MDVTAADHSTQIDALLAEGYQYWSESSMPALPQAERYLASKAAHEVYEGEFAVEYAAACQCFYLFRKLHGALQHDPTWATLLGDYFFSQFSKNLVPIDNVALTDSFSLYLTADTQAQFSTEDYLSFIRSLSAVLER